MSTVRRAAAFAVVGSIALVVPLLEAVATAGLAPLAVAAPFALIAAAAVFGVHEGRLFELFARPGERRERRLYGLIGFTLAASGLVLLAVVSSMPMGVGVGVVLLVAYGNLAARTVQAAVEDVDPALPTAAFATAGGTAFGAGHLLTRYLESGAADGVPAVVFLAAVGGLVAALLRTVLFESDDPVVMVTVGLWLWLLTTLAADVTLRGVAIALAVSVGLGYASYALETASIPGMLAGVSMGIVTIVLGDVAWFAVLIAFFVVGGLSTKFCYEEKLDRGVAEPDEGARGAANVLANGAVPLAAVLAYAAAETVVIGDAMPSTVLPVSRTLFLFVFVGGVSTAMSDTLSSEIGGVFDGVRLITTLDPVDPGTDGGVSLPGVAAGIAGAGLVGGVVYALFRGQTATGIAVGPTGVGVVVVAGVLGMLVDSLLGATVEGRLLGNGGVNLLATLSGGLTAGLAAVALGLA
jgi:uncharacterized protein (TIGR00297 family)